MPEAALADLQAWLQARVAAGAWDLPEDPAAGPLACELVVSSEALPAKARLAIYARSYVLRLAECLRAEYPVLRAMIGDEVFALFAGGYLSARPPRAYSLYDLGAGFADYLEATRPRPNGGPGAIDALPASLARLERAIAESGRAPGLESEAPTAPFDVTAVLRPGVRLRTPETLRLLRLDFDFSAALAAVRAGDHPQPPPARDTCVAVARGGYVVRAHRLEPWMFAWLEALADTQGDVQRASQIAAGASGRDAARILAGLIAWLPVAFEAGFVAP